MSILVSSTGIGFIMAFAFIFVWGGLIIMLIWGGLKWLYKFLTDDEFCIKEQKKYGIYKSQ